MIKRDNNNRLMILRNLLGIVAVFLFLSACSSHNFSDLNKYIEKVKNNAKGHIKPLPEVKTYESYTYQAQDLRAPFTPYSEAPQEAKSAPPGVRPPGHPTPEALEAFPLDSLKFVGTIQKKGELIGLISAPDKTLYRVKVGNFMGKNYGKVISMSETTIMLKEIIPNGSGSWVEREASLALSEQ